MTTQSALDENASKQWIGKTETTDDVLHTNQARLMQATMDRVPSLQDDNILPALWHWLYFHNGVEMSGLGRDGHPALGEFLPPVALPRRMWAGGRVEFNNPIHLGETITKTSEIKNVVVKEGNSGTLCFVTVVHTLRGEDGTPRLIEEQDIVYREDAAPNAPKPKPVPAPAQSVAHETVVPSTVQLFRYSALTFNSHRIHYDREYCQDVEGYPGIIFHGPLTATILADYAIRQSSGSLKHFSFRAVSPLFDTAPFTIHTDGEEQFWAETPEGNLAMKATALFE